MTMKKVININFQGRVIPIEETAYELLKQYIDSLRKYFANEEGRDEIVNDIEGRIAELFSERLKKGISCITDADVNAVVGSIGRPEDFDAQEAELNSGAQTKTSSTSSSSSQQQQSYTYAAAPSRGRLYRNADDKILGGVASGLANYLGIDPIISRILFFVFVGFLFWVYIILWIIVPSKSVQSNITKRLYRSAENKVIGGVAGGLAAYFNVDTWIPRLIFGLPIIVGLVSSPFGMWWSDWDFWGGPRIITGSLSFTLAVVYVILWIALPVAVTASEKLEMRGEKVDLNSIRNTVKEDLGNFKSKAQNWGNEVKQSAEQLGERAKEFGHSAKTWSTNEAGPVVRGTTSGAAHVIGVLFKAFFMIIGGAIALSLLAVMAFFFGAGFMVMPFKGYILENGMQSALAWSTLLFFFGVPIIAFLVWIIRKIAGSKKNPYIAYVFGVLWIVGLISMIFLIAGISRNFRGGARVQSEVMTLPFKDRVTVKVSDSKVRHYGGWWDFNNGDAFRVTEDSMVLSNVRLRIEKSIDSSYHVSYVRYSNGRSDGQAEQLAKNISYGITQWDSVLYLDHGFSIPRGEKFRNQSIMVTVKVPIGKRIIIDRSVPRKLNRWFSVGPGTRHWNDWEYDSDGYWVNGDWNRSVEYVMTPGGIERLEKLDPVELKKGRFKLKVDDEGVRLEGEGEFQGNRDDSGDNRGDDKRDDKRYRYRKGTDTIKQVTDTTAKIQSSASLDGETDDNEEVYSHEKSSSSVVNTLSIFGRMFRL
jgi:phage shock protein PspC (stress-responsive transcriptional regulator)